MSELSKFKVAGAFKHLNANHGLVDDISSGFTSIRYRGKTWALQHAGESYPFIRDDDGTPLSYIDMIILGISPGKSKVYFGKQTDWDEDTAGAPICASLKGDVPDPGVPEPQSKSCGICPNNEWGSGQGRGKACQDHKRMAVLLMPAMTKKMLKAPLLEPVHLKIPPGSFKSLKTFCDSLTHEGIPFASVVTRISFAPPPKLFAMEFKVIKALTDAEAPLVLPMIESSLTRQIVNGQLTIAHEADDDGPRLPPPQKKPVEEPIETGLLEALGGNGGTPGQDVIPPPKRGRQKKIAEEAQVEASPPESEKASAPMKPLINEGGYEDSDPDLDDTVAKLLSSKMNNMLK